MVLRVGYVREHFSSPLLQLEEIDKGETFVLHECPGGTGELIRALRDDKVDLVIALTDPLITGIVSGENYRLVGNYVDSPLNWAVITGYESKYKSIADLKGTTIGISRYGSGSWTMAAVMAMQHNWFSTADGKILDQIKFKENKNIDGLIESINDGSTSAFMWEWFTTKPWEDAKKCRFIGSVKTPWPSWMIAAHTDTTRAPPDQLRSFLSKLNDYVQAFNSAEKRSGDNIIFIKEKFKYPEADIKAWLETVSYPTDIRTVPEEVVTKTLNTLKDAGVVDGAKADAFGGPSNFAIKL